MQSSLLYGLTVIALLAIILFFYRSVAKHRTHVIKQVAPITIAPVWPWELTAYSYWPYWFSSGVTNSGVTNSGVTNSGVTNSNHSDHSSSMYRPNHISEIRPWGGASRSANGLHSSHNSSHR